MRRTWRVAWITGASSGIGAALAIELARSGVKVAASARRVAGLDALAARQPGIVPFPLDVTDAAGCARVCGEIGQRLGPIDLAVLNAGVSMRLSLAGFDPCLAERMMAVNYLGVVNGLAAVMGPMAAQRRGHVAVVGSLAGYRGFPRAAGYCASKAAVIALTQSLRPELETAGVRLSLINPGYVATEMTAKATAQLPWLMSSEAAAVRIVRGLERGQRVIAFPWQTAAVCRLLRVLPEGLASRLMRHGGS